MEPTLRFRETLVLAQMYGDSEREMEQQLPVVVRIRTAVADVNLLIKLVDDDVALQSLVKALEERDLPLLVFVSIQQASKRLGVKPLDQVADKWVEEVVERIPVLQCPDGIHVRRINKLKVVRLMRRFLQSQSGHGFYCSCIE